MKDLSKEGIVKNINNNEITVEIQSCSACSSCMIKNYCSTSESKQKEITIKTTSSGDGLCLLFFYKINWKSR